MDEVNKNLRKIDDDDDEIETSISLIQSGSAIEFGARLREKYLLAATISIFDLGGPVFSDSFHVSTEGKPAGRRRVFVQTETGCVLGMELDRSDNAHTVKRRLQLALNVPTEESSLTFGDLILNNDLSAVRNDSPLLLTRNCLHRSSSTPCLSPTGKNLQQRDQSGPIEILGRFGRLARINELVKDIVTAVKHGVDPIPVHSGLGGAYYFKNKKGESVAIVKPTDEEPFAPNNPKGFIGKALGQPGLKRSVRVGETGFREVAAYLLDRDHFANVPATVLVKITHSVFNVNDGVNGNKLHNRKKVSKIASLQQHAGNLLVRKLDRVGTFGQVELIPIDHGLCLPESLEDPYFEWIHWPQASIPFSEDELEYINNLDPAPAIFGLCLAEIGEMMSREFRCNYEEPSELEVVCLEARRILADREVIVLDAEGGEQEFQFDLDCEDAEVDMPPKLSRDYLKKGSSQNGFKGVPGRNPLSRLDECSEEDEIEVDGGLGWDQFQNVAKLSISMKKVGLGERNLWNYGGIPKGARAGGVHHLGTEGVQMSS
ncbi:Phosphatidylinositol 4-kinase gamma 7 [Vitis vinifera]|uniref:1-phosphatidylinositol 4-kinase n=1 Tax=Vitis vinifera TaxID=29760 RepID=A0A438JYZ2_VITVI|nr:Phosphatidylinositol 4-kinase gamma 7 [Vitis vinifera]